jgi:hypothetical protein
LGPDAFVLAIPATVAIIAVARGSDPNYCFGFSGFVALLYVGLSYLRMRYDLTLKEREIAAKYSAGRQRLRNARTKARLTAKKGT